MSQSNKPPENLAGIIVLDKPVGPSSMKAVAIVRRCAGGVRTGHAGTLDPLASGVLVLALGKATKSIERIMQTDKRYQTQIDLSAFTSTDDAEGERDVVDVASPPDRAQVEEALRGFVGEIEQVPPIHSAVKVNGRRAYKLARQGKTPELKPRKVLVYELSVLQYQWPMLEIEMHCGKGVYVRSIARDLGRSLGTGGHCTALRRTAVGPFTESMAVALDDIPDLMTTDIVMPLPRALELVESAAALTGPK